MAVFIDFSIVFLSFLLMILDVTFGGGYGTLLTPILFMAGYNPLETVPAILTSQIIGDFLALFFHQKLKNIELSAGNKTFKVAITLAILSSAGSVTSVVVALSLPAFYLELYIGLLVLVVGALVLAFRNRTLKFSWPRLLFLTTLAAFNKGLSGGGYGPLVSAGQILTGIEAKSAIAITALAEGATCVVAVISYIALGRSIDYKLLIMLSIGAAFSAPISAYMVKKIENRQIKTILGLTTTILGTLTLLKTLNTPKT